jgi:hypothetical protein
MAAPRWAADAHGALRAFALVGGASFGSKLALDPAAITANLPVPYSALARSRMSLTWTGDQSTTGALWRGQGTEGTVR